MTYLSVLATLVLAAAEPPDWSYRIMEGGSPCSAVLLADQQHRWLLTAKHCTQDNKPKFAINSKGQKIRFDCWQQNAESCGAVSWELDDRDLALIEVRQDMLPEEKLESLTTTTISAGAGYVAHGWSGGVYQRITLQADRAQNPGNRCMEERVRDFTRRAEIFRVTDPTNCVREGDSGAAVSTSSGLHGIVRGKNGDVVDVVPVIVGSPSQKSVVAIFESCSGQGAWLRPDCLRRSQERGFRGNTIAIEVQTFARQLLEAHEAGRVRGDPGFKDLKIDAVVRKLGVTKDELRKLRSEVAKGGPG